MNTQPLSQSQWAIILTRGLTVLHAPENTPYAHPKPSHVYTHIHIHTSRNPATNTVAEPNKATTMAVDVPDDDSWYKWTVDGHVQGYGSSVDVLFTSVGEHTVLLVEKSDSATAYLSIKVELQPRAHLKPRSSLSTTQYLILKPPWASR